MGQRRGTNKWDITLDGNNYKILKGQEQSGYSHGFEFIAVNEQERFSPEGRGHMVSRPDLRSFQQTDWSGGQTWFKPTLPNQDGRTYFQSSMFDAYSKPGNLVPLNVVTQTTFTESIEAPHLSLRATGVPTTVLKTTESTALHYDVGVWSPGGNLFIQVASQHVMLAVNEHLHGMVHSAVDNLIHVISGDTVGVDGAGHLGTFAPASAAETVNIITNESFAPGSSIFVFDGKEIWYDGDTLQYDVAGTATSISDDKMGRDMLANATFFDDTTFSTAIVNAGSINLAVATDRGIYYVKNVRTPSGQPQARIFRVQVTDAGSYIREPIGSLPEGLLALNCRWHMDSLLIIATPDWSLLSDNDRSNKFFRSQLWHHTQGTTGAIGTFDGEANPGESPLYFPKSDGTTQFISSDQRMWAFDSVRGGLHQVYDYPTAFASGIVSSVQAINTAGEQIDLSLGNGYHFQQAKSWNTHNKTGAWAAKSYTLVSNYFDFGIALEDKELVSVTALFDAGSSGQTFYIDVMPDNDTTWTTVATMTADNGRYPITTDITSSAITGNRFQYRIRTETNSEATAMAEFHGIGFKALSGETVEIWTLVLDGTEITNVENEKQDPNVALAALKVTAAKNVFVSMTDRYERSDTDASAVDVYVKSATLVKGDSGETAFQVTLTKVDV